MCSHKQKPKLELFPTCDDILTFIRHNTGRVGKKEICKFFNVHESHKEWVKILLRQLRKTGKIIKAKGNLYHAISEEQPLYHSGIVIEVIYPSENFLSDYLIEDFLYSVQVDSCAIIYAINHKYKTPIEKGARVMVKMNRKQKPEKEKRNSPKMGKIVKRFSGDTDEPRAVKEFLVRMIEVSPKMIGESLSKKYRDIVPMVNPQEFDVNIGDFVAVQSQAHPAIVKKIPAQRQNTPFQIMRVVQKHHDNAQMPLGLVALHEHQAPYEFSQEILDFTQKLAAPADADYEDLTHYDFITIDPADAKDHDDAVFAVPDPNLDNEGGYLVYVAIADVGHYVRMGTALDLEARTRGNSIYLPDKVVPMLPDMLSTDLCSLKAGKKRPALVVRICLTATGHRKSHQFMRAMIDCKANLSYEEVFEIENNTHDERLKTFEASLKPLFGAYAAACLKRTVRQPLALDMPEYKIMLNDAGVVSHIVEKQKLSTHQLIEEFMVMANVCAAETLQKFMLPIMYRVHEAPADDKVGQLKDVFKEMGFSFSKGNVLKPILFNHVLQQAKESPFYELINKLVLRCQSQAKYQIDNLGHFGLNLTNYVHFTSPIRRYADLMVHRALIEALKLGDGVLGAIRFEEMAKIADHISKTERRAMQIEMETKDRYLAEFMQDKIGTAFEGVIAGMSRAGMFVKVTAYGAEGLIPMGALSNFKQRYFVYDEKKFIMIDKDSGDFYRLGQPITVVLREAVPMTGGMRFDLADENHLQYAGKGKGGKKAKKEKRKKIFQGKALSDKKQ